MWFGTKISLEWVILFNFVRNAKDPNATAGNKVWRQRISQGIIINCGKSGYYIFWHIINCE